LDVLKPKPVSAKRKFMPLGILEDSHKEEPLLSGEEIIQGYVG
jgi:hypothetical protein